MVPKEVAVVKKAGMSLKAPDWAKDGGDKFYSLMEESDFTSSEHNQSESGSSISSTTEPTVRKTTVTSSENRRAWIATKRLQGTVRKVVKLCIEIEGKLNTMEERTLAAEADVEALREQCATQDGQLIDIMWKLEDHENRQRRNNLCFLGIGEGMEGNDIRAYMIKTLQAAFPELTNWD
ncbi:hypothetical protein NDU88_001933 [Pleurodeles waltl]|uniref:Uncharacterized protein n=1 Tax=Pleurodeles waltl TaxID=8319 RepID=A0AAV7WQV3_PLEWA|nr:hypothetical protein NDU88_001933 [Pleurodeles waltl]